MTPKLPSQRTDAEAWVIVEANTRLIWWAMARWFPWLIDDLEREESYSDGVLGLFRAAQLWQPERGKFSTYAVGWLRQTIGRGRMVRGDVILSLDADRRADLASGDETATIGEMLADDTARPDLDAEWALTMERARDIIGPDELSQVLLDGIEAGGRRSYRVIADEHGNGVSPEWVRRRLLAIEQSIAPLIAA